MSASALKVHERSLPVYAALVLVLTLYLCFGLAEVYRVEGLFSYDPYYHMHLSEKLEREGNIVTEIEYYEGSAPPQYVSSMRLVTVLLHRYTGLSYLAIYRTLGLFLRLLTALALFLVASRLLGNKGYGLVSVLVFLSSSYVFLRSLITFPENMAIFFHILIFGCIIDGLTRQSGPFPMVLTAGGAVYVHYRSLIVPAVMIAIYLLFRKSLRHAVAVIGGTAVLCLPVLLQAINQYLAYLRTNVGSSASWAPYATGAAYAAPNLSHYEAQLGLPMVLFAMLGIPFLLRKMNGIRFILLVWLLLTFVLTRGKAFGIYVPTNRMLAYLAVPAALASGFFIKGVMEALQDMSVFRAASTMVMAVFLSTTLVCNLINVKGWVGVSRVSLDAAAWLDENASENSIVLPYGLDLVTMGMKNLSRMASVRCGWREVFDAPEGVRAKLGELFPEKDIYIVSKTDSMKIHDAQVVFEEGDLRIYFYPNSGQGAEQGHTISTRKGCCPAWR